MRTPQIAHSFMYETIYELFLSSARAVSSSSSIEISSGSEHDDRKFGSWSDFARTQMLLPETERERAAQAERTRIHRHIEIRPTAVTTIGATHIAACESNTDDGRHPYNVHLRLLSSVTKTCIDFCIQPSCANSDGVRVFVGIWLGVL